MKRFPTEIFAILVSCLLLPTVHGFCGDNEKVMLAEHYLKSGLYLEAVDVYQEIAEHSDPITGKAKALLRMGDIYSYFLEDYDTALQKYDLVKTRYPASDSAPNAYLNSGMILYEKGKFRDALIQFRTYLKNYPDGQRRETAEYMVEACLRETPSSEGPETKRRVFSPTVSERTIRVLIQDSVKEAVVSATRTPDLMDAAEKKRIGTVAPMPLTIRVFGGGLTVNGAPVGDGLVIVPAGGDRLKLNGRSYRGKLRVKKGEGAEMDVVNVLDVEEYLYGVVPKEMSSLWPLESLKAQAVVARTFALYQKDKNKDDHYDVYCTTSSQVYGGFDAETNPSSRAVDSTRGEVLTYNGKLILAYYHANSGGATEDAKNVWTAEIPYLKGVRDPYSENAPDVRWSAPFRVEDISRSLSKSGIRMNAVRDVVASEVSPSGRIVKVRVLHDGGETTIRSNDFRIKLDARLLKSTFFVPTKEGDRIRFDGKGYGHGVGLSQWGAREMARLGFSYRAILDHYYSKVEISNVSHPGPGL